jgi:RNA polymerase sigma factor (sigma-70 family)
MDRHDRLVRYAIFRTARSQCVRDPQWLDAVASESWAGFVSAARRGLTLDTQSLPAYLASIARKQTISALRRLRAYARTPENTLSDVVLSKLEAAAPDPEALTAEVELLSALRECAQLLGDEDRRILTQLDSITRRKWVEAAKSLDLSESTLRSRWERILERLRNCMGEKSK